jgi:hypothetical protein
MAQPHDRRWDEDVLAEAAVFVVAERDAAGAAVALADEAELADAAGDDRTESNMLAGLEAIDAFTCRCNDAGDLVAGDYTLTRIFLAFEDADIGVAKAGGAYAQDDLAQARLRRWHINDRDIAGCAKDAGLHW